jgi:TonB family protein
LILFVGSAPFPVAQTPSRVYYRTSEELLTNILKWEEPEFPPLARAVAARVGGPVEVELLIDEEGNVVKANVISGHPLLQALVLKAAREWKFSPFLADGKKVRVKGRVKYEFPRFDAEEDDRMITQLKRRVRRQPRSARAYFALGNAYFHASRYREAIVQFNHAVLLDPRYTDAYLKLGLSYDRTFQTEEALAAYTTAVRLDPELSEALIGIGLGQMRLQKYDEAIKSFEKSLAGNEPTISAYFLMGKCFLLLNRPGSAIEIVKEGLEKHADSDAGYYVLGEAYLAMRNFDEAIAAFKKVIALTDGPGNLHAQYQLGIAYLRTGDTESALKQYEILQQMNNESYAKDLLDEINLRVKQDGKIKG